MGDDTEGVVPNKLWMGDVSDRLSAFSSGDLAATDCSLQSVAA